jgi:hypothetical protein
VIYIIFPEFVDRGFSFSSLLSRLDDRPAFKSLPTFMPINSDRLMEGLGFVSPSFPAGELVHFFRVIQSE